MNLAFSEWSVRLADCELDFLQACQVRALAYGHHDPELGPRFGAVEEQDRSDGTSVLLCSDRGSGKCLGTARIQVGGRKPLGLESGLCLPPWLRRRFRAQISRLAVVPGASPIVKLLLMKASYQFCLARRVRWMVIGARSAALIRNYRSLGFTDVFEPGAWVALASGAGLPHQILALDVQGAQAAWQATSNRLLGFMTEAGVGISPAHAANDGGNRLLSLQMQA